MDHCEMRVDFVFVDDKLIDTMNGIKAVIKQIKCGRAVATIALEAITKEIAEDERKALLRLGKCFVDGIPTGQPGEIVFTPEP